MLLAVSIRLQNVSVQNHRVWRRKHSFLSLEAKKRSSMRGFVTKW